MKVIKPFRLSVVTRCYEVQRRTYLGVSTLAFFDLRTGELLPEVALWQFAAEELGKDAGVDVGVPKRNAEFVVTGSVHTPGGQPQATCPATVRVGDHEKTVYAIGDRFWKGETQSTPAPFTSMPLSWARAFGGPGYPDKPDGKGAAPIETEHGPVQFLPNLELPGHPVQRPDDRPPPAGLVDLTRPQRLSKAGTYDRGWLEQLFPGLAADIDWRFWNTAPEDQQRDTPWRGDETFELHNLHPTKERIEGQLPGLTARTFLLQRGADGLVHRHVLATQLTTVWLFPHAEKGILVFQGALPTSEDDATDVTLLMLAAELLTQPRGDAHYERVLAERLDKDIAPFRVLADEDLLPPVLLQRSETADEIEKMKEIVTRDGVLEKRMQDRLTRQVDEAREVIASYGLDPDEHGPSQPEPFVVPDMRDLPALMARLEADAKAMKEQHERTLEAKLREVEPMMEGYGVDPAFLRAEMQDAHTGPPTFTAEGELARIRKLDAQSRAAGMVLDEIQEWLADEALHAKWKEAETAMRDAYLFSAHLQGTPPPLSDAAQRRARDAVLAALHAGEPFAHRDLTGTDLSGMDLRGADFRRGWLESTNLRGSNLEGANFAGAVLARADFGGAILTGANFRGANLGRAKLTGVAGARGADFTEATFMMADLTGADLSGAILDSVSLIDAVFGETRLTGVHANGLSLIRVDLRGLSLAGARLIQSSFVECNLAGVDFSGAALESVAFLQCDTSRANFAGARTAKLVLCLPVSSEDASFRGALLASANLRGVPLRRCDFSGACLDGADLSEADLTEARFYRAVARAARFTKANLQRCELTAANLMGADFTKADVRGARLIGTNLFGTSFARARSDTDTVLTDSLQGRVTIYPLWREQ